MKAIFTSVCVASLISFAPLEHVSAQQKVQATDLINIFEKISGNHPGFRKAHARGLCVAASFAPNQSEYFAGAKLLNNGELEVNMRFSLGGGNPNSDERTPGTRGMGMQIKLPDGSMHVFTGNNFPAFAGKDVETFYGFLLSLADPAKTVEYIKNNPSVRANVAWNQTAGTPKSYANTEFFGLHTFFYDDASGKQTKFRWHLTPDAGVESFTKEEAAKLENGFLTPALEKQIAAGEASFTLHASIGKEEDTNIDPSSPWPEDRTKVALGKITLNSAGGDACKNFNFDPNLLSAGFTPSEDPVLRMRSAAYAVSFGKRLSGQ